MKETLTYTSKSFTNLTITDSLFRLTRPIQSKIVDKVLEVGEIWTFNGNYTVNQADLNSNGEGDGFINNTAAINSDELGLKIDSAEVPVEQNPAYSIEKTIVDVAGKGPEGNVTAAEDVIAYQVNVINDGNVDLTNLNVTDSLISLSEPTKSNDNDTVLNVGESWTYFGNYTVSQEDINSNGTVGDGFINNNATVYGNYTVTEIDTNNNNTVIAYSEELEPQNATVQVPLKRSPNYSIFKSVIAPDENGDCIVNSPGDEIPYRIVVKNEGNTDLTNVTVIDEMIDLAEQIEVLNPGDIWAYTGIYTLTSDDINNGNGNITNNATVICNELPEESSSVETPIDQKTELSIYKTVIGIDDAGDFIINQPGDIINYQIAVKNNGNTDITGVSISDPLIALTEPTGDHTDLGILNPGELWVYTGDYVVTQEDIDSNGDGDGFIENTATVSYNENELGESSSIVLPIIQIPPTVITPEPNNSKVLPIANFSANPTSGYATLSVQFTDSSQNAVSRSWDFNNDGTADSSEVNPVYKYTTPGTYTANLTASNANGTNFTTKTITVLKVTSSSSGGSSHKSSGSSGAVVVSNSTVSPTGKTNATGNATVTQAQNNTPVEQNTESTAANVEQTPEQNTTGTPAKESKGIPGFEIVCGITGLLAVFLFRRR